MVDLAPREVTEGFVLVVIVAIVDVNVGITCMMLVLLHDRVGLFHSRFTYRGCYRVVIVDFVGSL